MPQIDVRPMLTDPTDPARTTAEIDLLGANLAEAGGGVLYFAAGDYHIGQLTNPNINWRAWIEVEGTPSEPVAVPSVDAFHQGGIRLRPRVSLIGEPGARLLWDDGNVACIIGAEAPLLWDEGEDRFVAALVVGSPSEQTVGSDTVIPAGTTAFEVETEYTFTEGDEVVIRLSKIGFDQIEVYWWSFAKVVSFAGDILTIDTPSQIPYTVGSDFYLYTHMIFKLGEIVDNVTVSGFHIGLATEPVYTPEDDDPLTPAHISGGVQAGIWLTFCRNITIENITAKDPGAGILVGQYVDNLYARNLHVQRSLQFGDQPISEANMPPDPTNAQRFGQYTQFGRGFSLAGCHNAIVENVHVDDFQTTPLLVEGASISCVVRNLYLKNNSPYRLNDSGGIGQMITTTGDSSILVEGLTVDGYGGFHTFSEGGDTFKRVNDVIARNIDLRTVPQFVDDDPADRRYNAVPGSVDLRKAVGAFRWRRMSTGAEVFIRRHSRLRVWSYRVHVESGAGTTVTRLPDGLLRRMRFRATTLTGVKSIYLVNTKPGGENKIDLLDWIDPDSGSVEPMPNPPLAAQTTIEVRYDATVLGADGFGQQQVDSVFEEMDRELWIETASNYPEGDVIVHVEYFPIETAIGTRPDEDGGWLQKEP